MFPVNGRRIPFAVIATSTPKLIVGEGGRWAFTMTTNIAVRIGSSGTLSTLGTLIPADNGFTDSYTMDEYWVIAPTSSGTVTGFIVV